MTRISRPNKTSEERILDLPKTFFGKPYTATTNSVQITVWPEFIDSKSSIVGDLFVWAYHVRIDNKTSETLKLINRHWRIIDEKGAVQEVDGEGVVGDQPIITAGNSYQYSSGVHLRHPSGIMTGKYQMQRPNLEVFEAKIPTFSLDIPNAGVVIN